MTTFAPAYRAVVYAGRNIDPDEATILTPAAGAVHSDPFKVATVRGLSGYQPYLDWPQGSAGSLDPVTGKWTVGQFSLPLIDARLDPTNNLERWVTAYTGDALGRPQLLGNLVYMEESLDWDPVALAGTWAPFRVGRAQVDRMSRPTRRELVCQDLALDLNVDVGGRRAASGVSFAITPTVLPLGLSSDYGTIAAADPLDCTVGAATNTGVTIVRILTLTAASLSRDDNLVTAALVKLQGSGARFNAGTIQAGTGSGWLRVSPFLRARVSCASPSFTDKELAVHSLYMQARSDGHYAVSAIAVSALQDDDGVALTSDPFYQAFDTGTVSNGTALTLRLVLTEVPTSFQPISFARGKNFFQPIAGQSVQFDPGTAQNFLSDVAPMTALAAFLDGSFGPLYQNGEYIPSGRAVGDPKYPIYYDTSESHWTALVTPGSSIAALPTIRMGIPEKVKLFDVLEKQFRGCLGIGYRFQAALVGGVPKCQLIPLDLRVPVAATLASIPTITDADITGTPQYEASLAGAVSDVSVAYYLDLVTEATDVARQGETIPVATPQLLIPVTQQFVSLGIGDSRAVAIGSKPLELDAWLIRATDDGQDTQQDVASQTYADTLARQVPELYRSMFGAGVQRLTWVGHRTANTNGLYAGEWCYLSLSALPSPGTNKRGDTRLVLVTKRDEKGLLVNFEGIDLGAGAVCASPTIGTPAQESGNTLHGVTALVTVNAAGDPCELRYLIDTTKSLTSAPADNDPRWLFASRITGTRTVAMRNLPGNVRVFVAARSVSSPTSGATAQWKIPSAWVKPSGTKYVDTAALSAPGAITILPSPILAASTVTAGWTNAGGSTAYSIEVELNGTVVATLVPGTELVTLNPYLAANTAYTLKLRYLDGLGGGSAQTSQTFTTPVGFGGPTLTAPTLAVV